MTGKSELQEARERLECAQAGRSLPATYEGRNPREGLSADLAVVLSALDQAREALGPIAEVCRTEVYEQDTDSSKLAIRVGYIRLAAQVYQALGGTHG